VRQPDSFCVSFSAPARHFITSSLRSGLLSLGRESLILLVPMSSVNLTSEPCTMKKTILPHAVPTVQSVRWYRSISRVESNRGL
jgi:hypothetical protein